KLPRPISPLARARASWSTTAVAAWARKAALAAAKRWGPAGCTAQAVPRATTPCPWRNQAALTPAGMGATSWTGSSMRWVRTIRAPAGTPPREDGLLSALGAQEPGRGRPSDAGGRGRQDRLGHPCHYATPEPPRDVTCLPSADARRRPRGVRPWTPRSRSRGCGPQRPPHGADAVTTTSAEGRSIE